MPQCWIWVARARLAKAFGVEAFGMISDHVSRSEFLSLASEDTFLVDGSRIFHSQLARHARQSAQAGGRLSNELLIIGTDPFTDPIWPFVTN
jgi:hypothetical protein